MVVVEHTVWTEVELSDFSDLRGFALEDDWGNPFLWMARNIFHQYNDGTVVGWGLVSEAW